MSHAMLNVSDMDQALAETDLMTTDQDKIMETLFDGLDGSPSGPRDDGMSRPWAWTS